LKREVDAPLRGIEMLGRGQQPLGRQQVTALHFREAELQGVRRIDRTGDDGTRQEGERVVAHAHLPEQRAELEQGLRLIGPRIEGATVGEARNLGLYGFGAAAHLLAQVARGQGRRVFAFTRPGDAAGQRFARELGAVWAGGSDERPGERLDAAIVFAPVGALIPAALACVRPGGRVVCAGIHMSDVPGFPYRLLWGERSVSSVANLTRADGREFLALATRMGLVATVQRFALSDANLALQRLRSGALQGAAVLEMPGH